MNELLEKPASLFEKVEVEMLHAPQIECPVEHNFVPGYYIRVFKAPKGVAIISKIHKTRHSFSISKGVVSVYDDKNGWQTYIAPFDGITEPGTQRALIVHEDIVWSTAHPRTNNETTPEQIEERIIENKKNPLLDEEDQKMFEKIKSFHSQNPQQLEDAPC